MWHLGTWFAVGTWQHWVNGWTQCSQRFFPALTISWFFDSTILLLNKRVIRLDTAGGRDEALVHGIIIRHIIIIGHSFLHPFLNSAEQAFHCCKPCCVLSESLLSVARNYVPMSRGLNWTQKSSVCMEPLHQPFWAALPSAWLYWNSCWQF